MFDETGEVPEPEPQPTGADWLRETPPQEEWQMPLYSLPWQQRPPGESLFYAFVDTVKTVLTEPSRAFENVQVEGSMPRAICFVLLMSVFSAVGAIVQQSLSFGLMAIMGGMPSEMFLVGGIQIVVVALIAPVGALVGSFLWAGLVHLTLMLLRANHRGFEGTYCVVAYSQAPYVLAIIPYLGGLAAAVWGIIVCIIGTSRVHRISTGRAAAGVLIPIGVLAAGCGLLFVGMFAFLAFYAASMA